MMGFNTLSSSSILRTNSSNFAFELVLIHATVCSIASLVRFLSAWGRHEEISLIASLTSSAVTSKMPFSSMEKQYLTSTPPRHIVVYPPSDIVVGMVVFFGITTLKAPSTNKDNIVNTTPIHPSIQSTPFDNVNTLPEEYSLCLLTRSSQPPKCPRTLPNVFLVLRLELFRKMIHHVVVKVLSSEVSVAISSQNIKLVVCNSEESHIKSTTTKIEDENVSLVAQCSLLVKTIRKCCSSGLIDNSHDIEANNSTSLFGGSTLRVVELTTIMGLSSLPEMTLNGQCFILAFHQHSSYSIRKFNEGIYTKDGVSGIRSSLVLSSLTHHPLRISEGNTRRRRSVALLVHNDLHTIVLPHSDARIGCSEIDPNGQIL
ncbi:Glutamate dehydrogenase, NAD-specific [Senna tora]|uniref:Glutamate dehydrogenase, NAD-specific n=1 Tax=Senna tora TaxID=362788 RepID=A0A834X651_9FABA|nr:Glutamate dehydrogenase, NAD-specific [Senna tora]